MKPLALTVSLLLLTSAPILSQQWLRGGGGEENDEAFAIDQDAAGNTYTAGYISDAGNITGNPVSSFGYDDIFVMRSDGSGAVAWVETIGGSQPDRAYGIASDAAGNSVVTGYVTGNVNMGGPTVSTYQGTQDLVVAKFDPNGNLLWGKTFGGPDIEIGYDVDIDQNGDILVVGQFKDSAYFGPYAFYSQIDPNTGLPAPDIFILKLDGAGNVLWAKHGQAPYEDRALAVGTDPSNNVYIAGQFSDTITFTNTYNNNMINGGFLMKVDPNGNELWFNRLAAGYVVPYDLTVTSTGDVVMTGDFGGLLLFIVAGSPTLSSGYSNSFFVARFNTFGDYEWSVADGSENDVSARGIDLDAAGDAYVTGFFECTMTEYSEAHDTGVFNTVGFRDIFLSKYDGTNGTRQWERHIGGPGDDYSGGIVATGPDSPIIAGSHEYNFNMPSSPLTTIYPENIDSSAWGANPIWQTYCSYPTYGQFMGLHTAGHKDIMFARPIDLSLAPYDYYKRTGSVCTRLVVEPAIENGLDTVEVCNGGIITVNTYTGLDGVIGPEYDYLWSTGSEDSSAVISNSGYYWVTVTTADGCKTFIDSIYALVISQNITPEIGTNYGPIANAIPINDCLQKLTVVLGDTAEIWSAIPHPGLQAYWSTPGGMIYQDTIDALWPGLYTLYIEDSVAACVESTCLEVYFYILGSGNCQGGVNFTPLLVDDNGPVDTVEVCENELFCMELVDSTLWSQGIQTELDTWVHWDISGPFNFSYPSSHDTTFLEHEQCFAPQGTGWCYITVEILHPISHAVLQVASFQFYLIEHPLPPLNPVISGPQYFCEGDTIMLTATGAPYYNWGGPGVVQVSPMGDTAWVTMPGTYSVNTGITDSVTGCNSVANDTFALQYFPQPQIVMNPADGLICPGDSVLLTGDPGVAWEWIGPQGNVLDTTQSVWVHEAGFYYYSHTNSQGCTALSEWVEVVEYATPFLEAFPGTTICAGGTIDLTVITNGLSTLWWDAPINDSSQVVTIDTTGTYTVSVSQCGITTSLTINITQSATPAFITPLTDTIICPTDTAILQANPGMFQYDWSNGEDDATIYVSDSGWYNVVTTDQYGCYGTSDSVYIGFLPQAQAPLAFDTTVCGGDSALLVASSTDTIHWYTQASAGSYFHSGDSLSLGAIGQDETYYIAVDGTPCTSQFVPITAYVNPSSQAPNIYGDSVVCLGDPLVLYSDSLPGFVFEWVTPSGDTLTGSNISIPQSDLSDAGTYSLAIGDSACSSTGTSITVNVSPLPQPYLDMGDTIVCPGEYLEVTVLGIDPNSQIAWSQVGQTAPSINIVATGDYYAVITDSLGCVGYSDTMTLSNMTLLQPPSMPDDTVCINGGATYTYTGSGSVAWYDQNFALLDSTATLTLSGLTQSATYYITIEDSNQCAALSDSFLVTVVPPPSAPVIIGDSLYCQGDIVVLTATGGSGTYVWSYPSGATATGTSITIPGVGPGNAGIYYAYEVSPYGCFGDSAAFSLVVQSLPQTPNILGSVDACEGQDFTLSASAIGATDLVWTLPDGSSDTASVITIQGADQSDAGTYTVYGTINGCSGPTDAITIVVHSPDWSSITDSVAVCQNDTAQLSINGTFTDISWIYNGFEISNLHTADFVHTSVPGNHYIDLEVTEPNGCTFIYDSAIVYVVHPPDIGLNNDTMICEEDGAIVLSVDRGFTSYLWLDSTTQPVLLIDSAGTYWVEVEFGPMGCKTMDSVVVEIIECGEQTPNVFTPNGDGVNDTWGLFANEAQGLYVEIYDRWGVLMYTLNDVVQEWDGTYFKNGKPCSDGVYYYIGHVVLYNGTVKEHHGSVHLFRER